MNTTETTSTARLRMANAITTAHRNPNRPFVALETPEMRLTVTYEPPMKWGWVDKDALKDVVAPSLLYTWQLVMQGYTTVLNDEADVLLLHEDPGYAQELRERKAIGHALLNKVHASRQMPLFSQKGWGER